MGMDMAAVVGFTPNELARRFKDGFEVSLELIVKDFVTHHVLEETGTLPRVPVVHQFLHGDYE
jgi:hypothetical protein